MNSYYMTSAKDGNLRYKVIAPNLRAGECGCWIGPFSGPELAKTFSETLVVSYAELTEDSIIENRNTWYINMPEQIWAKDKAH
jgi:hypothetical protein